MAHFQRSVFELVGLGLEEADSGVELFGEGLLLADARVLGQRLCVSARVSGWISRCSYEYFSNECGIVRPDQGHVGVPAVAEVGVSVADLLSAD